MYPHFGGIEQVTLDIGRALKGEAFEQKIICFNETAFDNGYVCHRNETVVNDVDSIEVIRCGCITKKASQSISLTFGRELDHLMKNFDPDIVIFHYPNPLQTLFLLSHKKRKFKLLVYWHLDITKQKLLKKLLLGRIRH